MSRPHEITRAFAEAGLPLAVGLVEMLEEDSRHRTERRGCGYTQATRFLSTHINQPRDCIDAHDLAVFSGFSAASVSRLAGRLQSAGWERGWRSLERAPAEVLADCRDPLIEPLRQILPTLRRIRARMAYRESRLFLDLMSDLLAGVERAAPSVAGMPQKPDIGSCSQAEEYFLEIAHGRIRRGGWVNTIVDDAGQPLMVEKMKLGESHSAMVVQPLQIFGVLIPPGGLCALNYSCEPTRTTRNGSCIRLRGIEEARFLRLTTLSVPAVDRERAFSQQLATQIRAQMMSPTTTEIEQLHDFARAELAAA